MSEQTQEGIIFFGEIDRNSKGEISSEYPAWYYDQQLENLEEDIRKRQHRLDNGHVHPTKLQDEMAKQKKQKERRDLIISSRPKLKGAMKDKYAKVYEDLANQVGMSLFSRSEMKMGLANPHEEANRMIDHKIKVDPELAKALGVRVVNKHISRNGAAKMLKIIGKALGDSPTNIEYFRKDNATFRTGV